MKFYKFRKKSHSAKKIPLVSNSYKDTVNTMNNSKWVPFSLLRLPGYSLNIGRKVCKKWTIQCEVFCGLTNKTGTSKVGAISKAQKAQSFLNMPRMYSWKALKTLSRHPKCAFHARYDWKITFPDSTGNKKKFEKFFEKFFFENFFFEKTSKTSHSAKKWKGGTLWDSLTYFLLPNIRKSEGGTLLKN